MIPMANLLALPPEVLEQIASYLWSAPQNRDAQPGNKLRLAGSHTPICSHLSLRLSCRQVTDATLRVFGRTFFTTVSAGFSRPSLERLAAISDRPYLCRHVRELRLNPRWLAERSRLVELEGGEKAWSDALRSQLSGDESTFRDIPAKVPASVLENFEPEREQSSLFQSGGGDTLLASTLTKLVNLDSLKLEPCWRELGSADSCYDQLYAETVDVGGECMTCLTHALRKLSAALEAANRPIVLRALSISLHPGGLFDLREDDMSVFRPDRALPKAISQVQDLQIRIGICTRRVGLVGPRLQRATGALKMLCCSRRLQSLTLDINTDGHILGSGARKWTEQMLMEVLLGNEPREQLRELRFVGWHEPRTTQRLATFLGRHAATLERVELKKTGWYQRPDDITGPCWPPVWDALAQCTKLERLSFVLVSAGIDHLWESGEAVASGIQYLKSRGKDQYFSV